MEATSVATFFSRAGELHVYSLVALDTVATALLKKGDDGCADGAHPGCAGDFGICEEEV